MNNKQQVSELWVERVHLGEASPAERAAVEADPVARARLATLAEQDAAFFRENPVEDTWRRIEGRKRAADAQNPSPNRTPWVPALLAPAMAIGAALVFVTIQNDATTGPATELTTPKGLTPRLKLYRQSAEGAERVMDGAVARKGDRLQVGVLPGDASHGVVVSIDGRGAVTLHYPSDRDHPTALRPGQELRTPSGFELDDAPEYERFFLVTTRGEEADVNTVFHAAEALAASGDARTGDLAVPKTYQQTSVLVRKEQR